jgi:histidyl-tRNA synthetase
MNAKQIQGIRGMNDILPEAVHIWEYFEDAARGWLHSYGYREIRTPILERTELFAGSIGEGTDIVQKEMYTFVDHLNGESLTLRPEGTAACVRAVVEHNLLYEGVQRLFYMGPMFRHERPAKGRYRQFHQVGVEALGFPGPDIDAEHLIMASRLWRLLGIKGINLELNSLGDAESRARYRHRLVSYFEKREDKLDADSRRRLTTNPLRILDSKNPDMQELIQQAPRITDDLDERSLKTFEDLQQLLREAGVAFQLNPRLVRGLDYYDGAVYEWTTDRLGAQGAVCAGGRYDSLVAKLGGKPAPACGFAMGIERLLELLKADRSLAPPRPDVYCLRQGREAERYAVRAAERMRDAGLSVVLHSGGGSFKGQMRKADASGARYAVIVGDDEAESGTLSVKPLREDAPQVRVSIDDAVRLIRREATGKI